MSTRVSARKTGAHLIHSTGPDVCKTPVGSSTPPIPYSSVAFFGSATRVSSDVHVNGDPSFHLNSRAPVSVGNDPGVAKGVKDSGHKGPAKIVEGSKSVFTNGWRDARHKDKAMINMSSLGPTDAKG